MLNDRSSLLSLLETRRSGKPRELEGPGPTAQEMEQILTIAARTPDHGKLAPWRFIVLEGAAKARFAERLEALANRRGETQAAAKLAKLKVPPLCVAVISSPRPETPIPEWEQLLSAGAAATTLLYATLAMGYGANWITDWYAYDVEATSILGLASGERVAGFMLMGTPRESPLERERPSRLGLVSRWDG